MATTCKACGVPLRWDKNAQGRPVPINVETGENHFKDCPKREQFKRPKETAK
jgi:hypothetical protein